MVSERLRRKRFDDDDDDDDEYERMFVVGLHAACVVCLCPSGNSSEEQRVSFTTRFALNASATDC